MKSNAFVIHFNFLSIKDHNIHNQQYICTYVLSGLKVGLFERERRPLFLDSAIPHQSCMGGR